MSLVMACRVTVPSMPSSTSMSLYTTAAVIIVSNLNLCLGQCTQNCGSSTSTSPWWAGWYIWAFVSFGIAIACGICIHVCRCLRRRKQQARPQNLTRDQLAGVTYTEDDDRTRRPHSIYIITVQHDSSTAADKPPMYTEIFTDCGPDVELPSYSDYISKENTSEDNSLPLAIEMEHISVASSKNVHEGDQTVLPSGVYDSTEHPSIENNSSEVPSSDCNSTEQPSSDYNGTRSASITSRDPLLL